MRKNGIIKNIEAIEILDSRGNPTLEVEVVLEDGTKGRGSVPSGASTGSFEAMELRDGDKNRFMGKGVSKAVDNVNKKISKILIGKNAFNQNMIDEEMIKLDDTPNKSNLGANSILGVSIAVADATAKSKNLELFEYIGGINARCLPVPMMNILNGGKHSDNNLNIQEFMIMPIGDITFSERIKRGVEIYHTLKIILNEKHKSVAVGDEGGFAPNLENDKEALDLIIQAIIKAGYEPKKDIAIALDIAASEMYEEGRKLNKEGYYFWKTGELKNKKEMIEYILELCEKYPIISVEDGLDEEDWKSWKILTKKIGNEIQLVGDDLFVTNKNRLSYGIRNQIANAILIKPNQIGTITETMETIQMAKENGYKIIISHRSRGNRRYDNCGYCSWCKCWTNKNGSSLQNR